MTKGRRSEVVGGWVNFPVDNPKYKNSGEGGLFVRLVVVDPRPENRDWVVCCGGNNNIQYDESFIRDDVRKPPKEDFTSIDDRKLRKAFDVHERKREEYEEFHFPHLHEEPKEDYQRVNRYTSIGYLAVLTIGSTGWSGWDGDNYWHCTYNDLTEEGKKLYNMIQKLYTLNGVLYLQTWLDT